VVSSAVALPGKKAPEQAEIDWPEISKLYAAGVRSLRDIGAQFGVTEGAIRKRAKRDGWERTPSPTRGKSDVVLGMEEEQLERPGFVYVVYIADTAGERFYKIGMAASFTPRFQAHQCASPFAIGVACAYYVGNMRHEERYLHARFRENRVRGEWFRLDASDLREIATRSLLV